MISWKKTLVRFNRQYASSEGTNSGDGLAGSPPPLPPDEEAPSSSILRADSPPAVWVDSPPGAPLLPISLSPASALVVPAPLRDTQTVSIEGSRVSARLNLSPSSDIFVSVDSPNSPLGNTHPLLLSSPPSSPGMVMSFPEKTLALPLVLAKPDLDPLPTAPSSPEELVPQLQVEVPLSSEDMRRGLNQIMKNYERLLLSYSQHQVQTSQQPASLQPSPTILPSSQEETLRLELRDCQARLAEALAQKQKDDAELHNL